jgi:hypothetical protein
MVLGLPDLNPLLRGMDLERVRIWILPFSQKGVERTEIMQNKILTQNFSKK